MPGPDMKRTKGLGKTKFINQPTILDAFALNRKKEHKEQIVIEDTTYHTIHVVGDGRCLFRCITAYGFTEIQNAPRNEFGVLVDSHLAQRETVISDTIRRNVVAFLSTHSNQLQLLSEKLPFLLDSKIGESYSCIEDRLRCMSKSTEYAGFLELASISYLTGHAIHIFKERQTDNSYELYTEMSFQMNPSKCPLALLYQVDNSCTGGHFTLLSAVDNDNSSPELLELPTIVALAKENVDATLLLHRPESQTFINAITSKFPGDSISVVNCQDSTDNSMQPSPTFDENTSDNNNTSTSATAAAADDLGSKDGVPFQPRCSKYNPQLYGAKYRDFQPSWFNNREWLEFSLSTKAAYCFCCRHFASTNDKQDNPFTYTGYSNWKAALDKDKGFNKHSTSTSHLQALATWKERQKRSSSRCSVSTLLNESQIEKNIYYIKSVAQVIQFLVVNELPLRGHTHGSSKCLDDESDEEPCGMFLKLFHYTLLKDEKLRAITQTIPENATYTSSMFQNEVITILANIVRRTIVENINSADIKYFTLKSDGTKDPTNTENISVVIRYVKNGHAIEDLLTIATSEKLDAQSITDKLVETLRDEGLSTDRIMSQCYDGASVMSGKHGGVQKLISDAANKHIPYFHCFNHQLHLVVVHAIGENKQVAQYFEVCDMLYNFLRRPTLARLYDGGKLKRLLDQRWSGHLATAKAVLDNYESLIEVLNVASTSDECDAIASVEAIGLLAKIRRDSFLFIAFAVREILELLHPADQQLQGREFDFLSALGVISAALTKIQNLRTHQQVEDIIEKVKVVKPVSTEPIIPHESVSLQPKRKKQQSRRLADSVIESTTGAGDSDDNLKDITKFIQLYFDIVDNCVCELKNRFSERNTAIASGVKCLWPATANLQHCDEDLLNPVKLAALATLIQVDIKSTTTVSECAVAAQFIRNHFNDAVHKNLSDVMQMLLPVKTAFPTVYSLYAAALTLGISTASCEASFSTLARILTPYRRSMTHTRKSNLVLLSYQEKYTRCIDLDRFIAEFNKSSRKLQVC